MPEATATPGCEFREVAAAPTPPRAPGLGCRSQTQEWSLSPGPGAGPKAAQLSQELESRTDAWFQRSLAASFKELDPFRLKTPSLSCFLASFPRLILYLRPEKLALKFKDADKCVYTCMSVWRIPFGGHHGPPSPGSQRLGHTLLKDQNPPSQCRLGGSRAGAVLWVGVRVLEGIAAGGGLGDRQRGQPLAEGGKEA